MPSFTCRKKCCAIQYEMCKRVPCNTNWSNSKAGAFIYDPYKRKILLVQSNGMLWGPPKGSRQYRESYKACAIREVYEETGINLDITELNRHIRVGTASFYYYVERSETPVKVQTNEDLQANDANAIGWINIDCLLNLIEAGSIVLTSHANIVLYRFLGIVIDYPTFTVVKRKAKKVVV